MKIAPVVALVDGNACARDALATLLFSDGYRTEVYESADEFLANAARSKAVCVVQNAQTGDFSGDDLSRRLELAGFVMPVLMLSAADPQSLMKQATEYGCLAFLRRPAETTWLLDFVSEAVVRTTDVVHTGDVADLRISLA